MYSFLPYNNLLFYYEIFVEKYNQVIKVLFIILLFTIVCQYVDNKFCINSVDKEISNTADSQRSNQFSLKKKF